MNLVTLDRLDSANLEVTSELLRFGLYDEPMQEVDTFLVTAGTAHGWHWYGGSGEIHIPRVSLSRLWENLRGEYTSLRDVLRHEFAHALADTHRGCSDPWSSAGHLAVLIPGISPGSSIRITKSADMPPPLRPRISPRSSCST